LYYHRCQEGQTKKGSSQRLLSMALEGHPFCTNRASKSNWVMASQTVHIPSHFYSPAEATAASYSLALAVSK